MTGRPYPEPERAEGETRTWSPTLGAYLPSLDFAKPHGHDGEHLPHMTAPYRVEAPAFSEQYRDTITEAVQAITKWIDAEVEAGATDHLVTALRRKGWTVTPPPDPAACDTVQILVPDDGATT
ncbi:hypothetical protein QDA01_gp14 [Microbacterium phage Cinna]|uniref:Uncharacterized protein n=1 Tax=Microbacterium phage Cinna TaxID=2591215 RepID=A0A514DDJ2_9CAUD|nr:hypothetical protein QDA01_gp14 [Microbacterium phage Cinna]QDH91675.1 hypothetical protein PBI_CINNA_91 [Microbacterium phage Cinna]